MQFLDCKITLSFSNQKIKDRSETLINKGKYEVKIKFIVSLIFDHILTESFHSFVIGINGTDVETTSRHWPGMHYGVLYHVMRQIAGSILATAILYSMTYQVEILL